jgi:hypothetical protein
LNTSTSVVQAAMRCSGYVALLSSAVQISVSALDWALTAEADNPASKTAVKNGKAFRMTIPKAQRPQNACSPPLVAFMALPVQR